MNKVLPAQKCRFELMSESQVLKLRLVIATPPLFSFPVLHFFGTAFSIACFLYAQVAMTVSAWSATRPFRMDLD